jgi:hypothetical protein
VATLLPVTGYNEQADDQSATGRLYKHHVTPQRDSRISFVAGSWLNASLRCANRATSSSIADAGRLGNTCTKIQVAGKEV